jgi:alpha-L-fucosidase 2
MITSCRLALLVPIAFGLLAAAQPPAPASQWLLWYSRPAPLDHWTEALPIGNGRLGAMVFGGTPRERIQLNEDTIWNGRPENRENPEAHVVFPEVRQLLLDGKVTEAEALAKTSFDAIPPDLPNYETLGDLLIDFLEPGELGKYRRQLDLDSGIVSIAYSKGGIQYRREIFASAVDHVIVIHCSANRPNSISFTAQLSRPSAGVSASSAKGISLRNVSDPPNAIQFSAEARAFSQGGTVTSADGTLRVRNATAVTLLIAAGTSFETNDVTSAVARALSIHQEYLSLRSRQIADQRKYFRRVSLQIGPKGDTLASLPTDQRLERVIHGQSDHFLEMLYFEYGRYLLMASSRPDSLVPANLQGIWNERMRPPWGSMFTININTEMNYWLGEVAGLPEMQEPLFTLIDRMKGSGSEVARDYYGAGGFVAHHNTDIWGDAVPIGGLTGIWPMSAAWLSLSMWEHYAFSGDRRFLSDRAYPTMRAAAQFFLDYLVDDGHGYLVTGPSVSPENRYKLADGTAHSLSMAPTMDIEICRALFGDLIQASDILHRDSEFRDRVASALERLPPFKIGKYGQLQEWSQDYAEVSPGHRHISHLWALYPGDQIDIYRTPSLAAAARISLERRLANGGGNTGWSRAWVMNYWARLGDGDQAYESLLVLLRNSTFPNLFDNHPVDAFILRKAEATEAEGHVFEIDGNFGGAAAIAEMLLQSQDGEVRLLPALPGAWPAGEFRRFRARGGCLVSARWQAGKALWASIYATKDGPLVLLPPRGQNIVEISSAGKLIAFQAHLEGQTGAVLFKTRRGMRYRIAFREVESGTPQ